MIMGESIGPNPRKNRDKNLRGEGGPNYSGGEGRGENLIGRGGG